MRPEPGTVSTCQSSHPHLGHLSHKVPSSLVSRLSSSMDTKPFGIHQAWSALVIVCANQQPEQEHPTPAPHKLLHSPATIGPFSLSGHHQCGPSSMQAGMQLPCHDRSQETQSSLDTALSGALMLQLLGCSLSYIAQLRKPQKPPHTGLTALCNGCTAQQLNNQAEIPMRAIYRAVSTCAHPPVQKQKDKKWHHSSYKGKQVM